MISFDQLYNYIHSWEESPGFVTADAGPSDLQRLHPPPPVSGQVPGHQTPSPTDYPSPPGALQIFPPQLQEAPSLQNIIDPQGQPLPAEPFPNLNISPPELGQIELPENVLDIDPRTNDSQEDMLLDIADILKDIFENEM